MAGFCTWHNGRSGDAGCGSSRGGSSGSCTWCATSGCGGGSALPRWKSGQRGTQVRNRGWRICHQSHQLASETGYHSAWSGLQPTLQACCDGILVCCRIARPDDDLSGSRGGSPSSVTLQQRGIDPRTPPTPDVRLYHRAVVVAQASNMAATLLSLILIVILWAQAAHS